MPSHDESLLLRDLRSDRGEEAARALYRTYSGELYGFALNRLGDRGLAEEVVQDVFMRVWRHAAEYDSTRGSVRTWLYGIARNAIVDLERHRSRRPPVAAREPDAEGGASHDEPIERALLRWQVQAALERLTPELGAYVLGALPEDDEARVREHLASCTECRQEHGRLAGLVPLLDLADPMTTSEEPSPLLEEAVLDGF